MCDVNCSSAITSPLFVESNKNGQKKVNNFFYKKQQKRKLTPHVRKCLYLPGHEYFWSCSTCRKPTPSDRKARWSTGWWGHRVAASTFQPENSMIMMVSPHDDGYVILYTAQVTPCYCSMLGAYVLIQCVQIVTSIFTFYVLIVFGSPWYHLPGWPGVKNQLSIYL